MQMLNIASAWRLNPFLSVSLTNTSELTRAAYKTGQVDWMANSENERGGQLSYKFYCPHPDRDRLCHYYHHYY